MTQRAKEAIVCTLICLFGFVLWLSLASLLPKLSWNETALITSAIISTIFLLTLWGVAALAVENGFLITLAWAVMSYSGLIFFWSITFLTAATALFLFGIIGYFRARGQIQKTLEGGVVRPLRRVLPLSTTALAIAIAAAAYVATPPASLDVRAVVPEFLFNRVVGYLEPAIRAAAPDIRIDDRMTHAAYITSVQFLERQAEIYKNIFPVAYAVGFFATLRLFGIVLYWFAIMLVALLLRILRRFGIIELRAVPATVYAYSFS